MLNTTTRSFFESQPLAYNGFVAAHAAPPSGQTSRPVLRDSSCAAGVISLSGTATAVPRVSRKAVRQMKPPIGEGTRRPYASVLGDGHGSVFAAPSTNPFTTGAQPSAWTLTSRGRRASIQPIACISSNAFHMPTRPVPPPVG